VPERTKQSGERRRLIRRGEKESLAEMAKENRWPSLLTYLQREKKQSRKADSPHRASIGKGESFSALDGVKRNLAHGPRKGNIHRIART